MKKQDFKKAHVSERIELECTFCKFAREVENLEFTNALDDPLYLKHLKLVHGLEV